MKGQKKLGFAHESQNAVTVEWYTPSYIFDGMGINFDVDVCAPVGGIDWIPANKYYTQSDDGLAQDWQGVVWCNPPYGKETPNWLRKIHEHGNGVALVFARTDCRWFHDYCAKSDAILFMKGRVRFVDKSGISRGAGSGSGSMLVAWGDKSVTALDNMQQKHGGLLVRL